MEHFYTIQGEGFYQGSAAYFIRLAGCDVGCHWCDVPESWTVNSNQLMQLDELVEKVLDSKTNLVVITGGEPLMYNLEPLTNALHQHNLLVNIETSGVYDLSGDIDYICFSPKKFKAPKQSIYNMAHELKVIIYNKSDLKWAEEHASKLNDNTMLFLQPEWSKRKEMMPIIVDYIKHNPKWKASIQTHKYMDIP